MVDRNGTLLVAQSDWYEPNEDGQLEFWISCEKGSESRIRATVTAQSTDDTKAQVSDDRFDVSFKSHRSLLVKYIPDEVSTTFIPVAKAFKPAGVDCGRVLDINEQGIGVSCDKNNAILLWDTYDNACKSKFEGHFLDVYCLKFFPSGLVLLSGGGDMLLKIWSIETGQCHRTLMGHKRAVTGIGFVERGRHIISCSDDGSLRFWDCGSATCIKNIPHDGECLASLTTGGKVAVVASSGGFIRSYDMRSYEKSFEMSLASSLNACEFLRDNLVICGGDNSIGVVDLRHQDKALWNVTSSASVLSFKKWREGALACMSDGRVHCLQSETLQSDDMQLSGCNCGAVYSAGVNNSNKIFTCSCDGLIRVYEV
ncbi:Putative proteasomal atpase-associated factor 1 [Trichuris trichiura]|uniref:Putative proteasomal atpase-associated factor 1 n=1 Tax=Trichuris trichiura TaxID=36087 RepID=A0A077Z0C7_TRITR|nr:Putative proteasomal atpase-associated factor 1 [Trichuris trichiura]